MMQVVIEISEHYYEILKYDVEHGNDYKPIVLIANGIPLPKGHGRIGDLDKLIKTMKERNEDNGGEPLNAVDRGYDLAYRHMTEEVKECVIIEADKESEDANSH